MQKFFSCCSGWHCWPEHLSEYAERCCKGVDDLRPDNKYPSYRCHSGEHSWLCEEKAVQCCNTHIRVWIESKTFKSLCGREMVLQPIIEIGNMDNKSSADPIHLLAPKLM